MVHRIFVEKKPEYDVEALAVFQDLRKHLQLDGLTGVRLFNRYDVMGIDEQTFIQCQKTIFSEPQVDMIYGQLPQMDAGVFAVEYLPGQYDQRADSCAQCISLLTGKKRPEVRSAKVYALLGRINQDQMNEVKRYLINPVESREAELKEYITLEQKFAVPEDVPVLTGFIQLDKTGLTKVLAEYGLAMDFHDIALLQDYFRDQEHRDPTMTEIRMIDTYWSDHCRHTTFSTEIDSVDIGPEYIKKTYEDYLDARKVLGRAKKPVCLMDLATIAAKQLKAKGLLAALDESEEINACSVKIAVMRDGEPEDWLLMFKNETHNHPTEIEPFGGAATCLGGAIRDPLSGRSYVYQAMRITGSGDPRSKDTLPGKLPQRKITVGAAQGYSAYGNQIGLATGYVREIYHEGYVAKRMEVGAVVGAAPGKNIIRERPEAGDVVLLIGGMTGRDGCGGATGSSKSHTAESIHTCGAQVQKGNPPEERKIQRLFRKPEVTRLIKRCNDFGAGGVSVAIGELADGLRINLDAVPKKYEGLDGTELAISESQERMAVVVAKADADKLIAYASEENLLAVKVAEVTDENRLQMDWRGKRIVDISRDFLNENGADKHITVEVDQHTVPQFTVDRLVSRESVLSWLSDLNRCCQKGLGERFDSTIGAGSLWMPYGGKEQLTPIQVMGAKIPVLDGDTTTCSLMAYGFDPYLSEQSPYHGAMYAVVESVAKLIASGGRMNHTWLSFQEYFPKLQDDPKKWGLPFAALLGAYASQMGLEMGAIGGKDSMSGTFEQISVPPTLISFAVSVGDTRHVVSPEFKGAGHALCLCQPRVLPDGTLDFAYLREMLRAVEGKVQLGEIEAAYAIGRGGLAQAVAEMAVGNQIGCRITETDVFSARYGAILVEIKEGQDCPFGVKIGETIAEPSLFVGDVELSLQEITEAWRRPLEDVFPLETKADADTAQTVSCEKRSRVKPRLKTAKPKVVIPVFPGTNCEYDTARAFQKAGAVPEIVVIRNLNGDMIQDSVKRLGAAIRSAQMVMLPGGFSGGDEPDGSGKFISVFFRNREITDSVMELLHERDGLMLGICNGFQALIKLGLVPFGEIRDCDESCPTLTYNRIGRHQSRLVRTRIASVHSPWLKNVQVGDIHTIPVSHGEGRFVASKPMLERLLKNGQVATQYVDEKGRPSMKIEDNPNASMEAVEGILSVDGRVFGKMGHSERIGKGIYQNVPGEFDQKLFLSGVEYFQ